MATAGIAIANEPLQAANSRAVRRRRRSRAFFISLRSAAREERKRERERERGRRLLWYARLCIVSLSPSRHHHRRHQHLTSNCTTRGDARRLRKKRGAGGLWGNGARGGVRISIEMGASINTCILTYTRPPRDEASVMQLLHSAHPTYRCMGACVRACVYACVRTYARARAPSIPNPKRNKEDTDDDDDDAYGKPGPQEAEIQSLVPQ